MSESFPGTDPNAQRPTRADARAATEHSLIDADSREMSELSDGSIDLIITSPPKFDLCAYPKHRAQLGNMHDYRAFLNSLDEVWFECLRLLTPGGRLCCVTSDVCKSKAQNGRYFVLPLVADIITRAASLGFDYLVGIDWRKLPWVPETNGPKPSYLGKPNRPNGAIRAETERILIFRKPGTYRKHSRAIGHASAIAPENYSKWFSDSWSDIPRESRNSHPAPMPVEVPRRLLRMYSYLGDTVLDPFVGTGTTMLAAMETGRNSVGFDIETRYLDGAAERLSSAARINGSSFSTFERIIRPKLAPATPGPG